MLIDENWGVSIDRIRQFFLQQPDVQQTSEGFSYMDCGITLTELPGQIIGKWNFPRTRVRMEGSDGAVKAIHRRFYLRFLSAGG